MKYLVTGGAGFIGIQLTNQLIKLGHEVIVLDDLSYGNRDLVNSKAILVIGTTLDYELCLELTKNVDGVFHLAAFSRSGPSINMPFECHRNNVEGTLCILKACSSNNVKRIIYSGSSTFYGNKLGIQREHDRGDFLNFYGLTKHVGELYVQQFGENYNLEFNILRYFNVYGPGQPKSGAYALVLGIFLEKLRRNEHIEIHGSGQQRRDFIHVHDVVEANIKAMNSHIHGEIFNIGSGINYSILELANFFPIQSYHTARRFGDADETLADISKARKMLKWNPQINLETGLNQLFCEL
jgi:nucleoside-diphosphate-sugar epimerase